MPIYDLFCPKECGYEEEFLSLVMTSDYNRSCPSCEVPLKKKVAAVGHILKGPGFYATEHGKAKFNNYKEDKKEILEREEFIEQAKQELQAPPEPKKDK